MKIKEGFIVKNIGDHDIVVPIGERAIDFNGVITLNKTAKVLFEKLQVESTYEELVEILSHHFDAPIDVIKKDITSFIQILKDRDLLV